MNIRHSTLLAVFLVLGLVVEASARSNDEAWFSQAELDQMLAPIALYPDTVLSHVLIAATYPLEVVQAARWSRANPGLTGQDAVEAVGGMDWDPSVMALVAFPELLDRLDQDIDWTHRLGDAFLFQEEQVVGTIQSLREQAYAHGHLRSNDHVRVVRETRYIYIEPARTRVVHLPYYDPVVVYGGWRWSHYPPVRWHHPVRFVRGVSFFWGPAYRIAPTFYFSSFHWSRRQVVVVKHHHHHHYHGRRVTDWRFHSGRDVARYKDAYRWQHEPRHRRGVSYRHNIDTRYDHRQLAGEARATASDFAAVRQQVETRRDQRSWASDRRDSLRISDRSGSRSTPSLAGQASRERLRSAPSRRAPARSDAGSAPGRSASAAPSTRQRSGSAARVREQLERSSAPPSRASTRPAAVRNHSGIEVPRSSTRPAPTRSAPPARATRRFDRDLNRASAPARSSRSTASTSPRASRPVPRSQAPRSMAPARTAPARTAPPRSAPMQSAPARSAPTRSYPGRAAPRAQAPRRSHGESSRAPSRSAVAPSRQRGQTRQRARSASESRIRG
jgi:hypothetical protein